MSLSESRCEPCEGNVPKLGEREAAELLAEVPGWRTDDGKLVRRYAMRDFATVMAFVNRIAAIAEAENHHPDFRVFGWNKVEVTIFTHAVGGLTKNDFVLAAKIDDSST